jgi:hypothetical protein
MENTEHMDNENKIKKVLFNEISFLIAGIGLISSVIFWVTNPQNELEIKIIQLQSQVESYESVGLMLQKFKDNDLHELQLRLERMEEREIEMMKSLARLEALYTKK